MLKEYLVRYRIDREATFGIAVVVASSTQNAISILESQGSYNGAGYKYQITEVALINDTDKYSTSSILEEVSTSAGYSAYEIAKKYGYTGSEKEWLTSLKGEDGKQGPQGPQGPRGEKGDTGDICRKVTHAELLDLKNRGALYPGVYYRIVNYNTTTSQLETRSAGHPFDVIVPALSNDKLSERAWAIQHTDSPDDYFANSKLKAWQLWYCLDNDTNRFTWADTTDGKGVIYRMIDEFGNDCSYDFKNIQFKYNNVYNYTFSSSENDSSLSGEVRDNILMPYSGRLHTTIFKGAAIGNKIQSSPDTSNRGYTQFVFEKSATYNDIRATLDTAKISAKGNFDSNVLLIRRELTTNGAFSNNYVQYLSSPTTINGDFYANQLDTLNRNSAPLTINCGRMQQCTIYGCGTLSIANTNGATTGAMGYSTINLGMNGSNVKLLWNTTSSLNNRIEGLNIKAYNWGTSEVAVDITNHPVNATYPLTIAKDKLGNVKMWCEADLVE